MTKLVEWTSSEHLTGANQTNRLRIGLSSQFSLYARDPADRVTDGTYSEGGFGVYVGADQTRDFTVNVDEVAYWEMP
jgi:hypothetical protein